MKGQCPACSGPGVELGILGPTIHYRCRDCGIDFSHTPRSRKKKGNSDDNSKQQSGSAQVPEK